MSKVIVSACLAGVNCRYNQKPCPDDKLISLLQENEVILVCPELLGGEPTPRPACNLHDGDGHDVIKGKAKIIGDDGKDYTETYLLGAKRATEIALNQKVTKAYLKSGSPTCGCGQVYSSDGKTLVKGDGLFTAMLLKNAIPVISSES